MENRGGPFCRLVSRVKIICEIATFVVFYDGYLVYSDHSLIIIKRLIASYLYFRVYLPCDYEADRLLCRMYDEGKSISLAHFDYINPLPKNTEEVFSGFKKIIVCELNSGHFAAYLRNKFPQFTYYQHNKVQGQPFIVADVVEAIRAIM